MFRKLWFLIREATETFNEKDEFITFLIFVTMMTIIVVAMSPIIRMY